LGLIEETSPLRDHEHEYDRARPRYPNHERERDYDRARGHGDLGHDYDCVRDRDDVNAHARGHANVHGVHGRPSRPCQTD